MRSRILAIGRWGLIIWGALSLVGVIGIASIVAFQVGPGNRVKDDSASAHEVRFVLNWCELGDQRIDKVIHSHVSARSFTGDYLDAYAIKISRIDLAELTKDTDDFRRRWYRGDQLPKILDDAVGFVGGWLHEVPWFPSVAELRSSDIYVYSWSIYFHGIRPTAAELIFIRPSDKMVFYFGGKT